MQSALNMPFWERYSQIYPKNRYFVDKISQIITIKVCFKSNHILNAGVAQW